MYTDPAPLKADMYPLYVEAAFPRCRVLLTPKARRLAKNKASEAKPASQQIKKALPPKKKPKIDLPPKKKRQK